MMEVPLSSYAAAVAAVDTSNNNHDRLSMTDNTHKSTSKTMQSVYERLIHPTPESLTLISALQLLQPIQVGDTVYLLPVEYLQNWLYWAYQQACVSPEEEGRAREALKQAAFALHLIPPTEESAYHMPGPMDVAQSLAVQGHPLVLQPTVRLHRGHLANGGGTSMRDDRSTVSAVTPKHLIKKAPPLSHANNNSNSIKKPNSRTASPLPLQRQASSSSLKFPPASPGSKKSPMNGHSNSNNNNIQRRTTNTVNHAIMSSSMNRASAIMNGVHHSPSASSLVPSNNKEPNAPECLAVPEAFYLTLRSVHGVLCQDGYTVTFQQSRDRREQLLLHHEVHKVPPAAHVGQQPPSQDDTANYNNSHKFMQDDCATGEAATPIEFRRKVIAQPLVDHLYKYTEHDMEHMSLMERLLIDEERRRKPHFPVPEIHPIKLLYRLQKQCVSSAESTTSKKPASSRNHDGFVLVSQQAVAVDALAAMLRAAASKSASQTVRLWSRFQYPWAGKTRAAIHGGSLASSGTAKIENHARYELVDFDQMIQQDAKAQTPLTVGEWVQRHTASGTERQIECLIEVKPNISAAWPRERFEFLRRLSVGDFCDAQDVAGKWYEARIVRADEETVTVHYFGWATRWDAQLKRWPTSTLPGPANKLHPPAPLWSHTPRWRERIEVGDIIEVRDTSSLVHRPKWYKGEVKRVGRPDDKIRSMDGGADLELYQLSTGGDDDTHAGKEPLLLLDRCQQILVEVAQERTEKASSVVFDQHSEEELDSAGSVTAEPPFLRWVNLYGEEICQMGTHLKPDDGMKTPSILKYELEQGRKPVEIMKSHPSLGGSGFMRESLRGAPPAPGSVGLHNLGNSCFLNSTVQCLNHMEIITQYFLRDTYCAELNRQNPLGSGGNVAMAYASLIKKMWSGDYSVLAPRSLKQTVAAFAPQFDNSYQHDSQEFCQFLMDGLHEDLNRVKQKPYVEELEGFGMEDQQAAVESWRKHLLRHDSIFVDHCQGMHRSHLTCPQCGRESIKFDVYSSISLPLASKKDHTAIQLEDCIEMFMEGEQLDERNAWYCPSCRRHVCALKLIALWSAPDILILHLKRFQFDTCMTSGGMLRSKVDDTVNFPIESLDLGRFILGPVDPEAPPVYKLFGVSEHMGVTANSGHYTATVRNSIDGQWYRCNDSHVGRTSGEAAITGGAYVLFYQRVKGVSRWAGMEKVMNQRRVNPYGALEEDQDGFKRVKTKKSKKKGPTR